MKPDIQKEWLYYRAKVYPNGLQPNADRQLRQAFISGAWIALVLSENISKREEDIHALAETYQTFMDETEALLNEAIARNIESKNER